MRDLLQHKLNKLEKKKNPRKPKTESSYTNYLSSLELISSLIDNESNPQTKASLLIIEADFLALENRYNELYNESSIAYFVFDDHGIIDDLNTSAASVLCINQDVLLTKHFVRYVAPEFQHIFYIHLKTVLMQKTVLSCELKILKKSGLLSNIILNSKRIKDNITGKKLILSFVSDMSTRNPVKPLDVNSEFVNKPYLIYELTATLTQEINHPVGIINNYLYGCIRRLEANSFEKEDILRAMHQSTVQLERITEIILRMKNFDCYENFNFEPICINMLISNAIELLKKEVIYFPITISCHLTEYLPLTLADKIHLEQAILNLLRNAVDAMRDGNIVDPKLIIETNFLNSSCAEICIMDNGPSWCENISNRLFELDFSTKLYGVGLGLAISKSIIESHGGKILIESQPRGGACSKITLPLQKNQSDLSKQRRTSTKKINMYN
jgi:PAS domain S-box-containing protein